MKLSIQTINSGVLTYEHFEVDFVKSHPLSIAKGKCFVIVKENNYHYEIDIRVFDTLLHIIEKVAVDLWEEDRSTVVPLFTDLQVCADSRVLLDKYLDLVEVG